MKETGAALIGFSTLVVMAAIAVAAIWLDARPAGYVAIGSVALISIALLIWAAKRGPANG